MLLVFVSLMMFMEGENNSHAQYFKAVTYDNGVKNVLHFDITPIFLSFYTS